MTDIGGLTPVSFAKPIKPEPRLTEKYVPGRKSSRFWTQAEMQVIRDHYHDQGASFCQMKLPGRPLGAIYRMASKLGIQGRLGGGPKVKVEASEALDDRIRTEWMALDGKVKGEVAHLATKLGVRRHWLSQRATKLGLTVPRVAKEPPWSDAELSLLNRVPLHQPQRCARIFRAHGFARTATGIIVKAKRVGLSRRYDATLSARKAAQILGVDGKAFTRWIAKGIINAEKRPTSRLPQQGGDPWSVTRADFRQWIIDNVELIDMRKVDKFAFVDLLTRVEAPAEPDALDAQP